MSVERPVKVWLRANADQFTREMVKARAAVRGLTNDIDTTNARGAWMAQGLLAVGPAAVTAGAVAVPALQALATQATIGGAAVGVLALGMVGLGDGLTALNRYQLEPTTANFEKLQLAMRKLGPDGADFVRTLDEVGSKLSVLRIDSRQGMFPGFTDGLNSLLERLPELRSVVQQLAAGIGELGADAGKSLASSEFDEFFWFLQTEAKPILVDTGRALGNFIEGYASLMVAFGPLTHGFTTGLLDMSRAFEQWAENLSLTQGFADFTTYVRENTPDVLDALDAIGGAMVDVAKAAAPVGEVMVPALEALFDLIGRIADTPFGSFLVFGVAVSSLVGRLTALRSIAGTPIMRPITASMQQSARAAREAAPSFRSVGTSLAYLGQSSQYASSATLKARSEVVAFGRAAGPAAASVGLFAASLTPLPEKLGLSNTAMLSLVGLMAGPWGVAAGAATGAFMDLTKVGGGLADTLDRADLAMQGLNVQQIKAAITELEAAPNNLSWLEKMLGGSDVAADRAAGKIKYLKKTVADLEAMARNDELTKRIKATRQAAQDSADAFRDLSKAYEAPKLSLQQLITQMEKWARASRSQTENIEKALSNGVTPQAVSEIQSRLGPGAGLVFEQLARGGRVAARRVNEAFSSMQEDARELENTVGDLRAGLETMPSPTLRVRDSDFIRSMRNALELANVLDDRKINPWASMNVQPLMVAAGRAQGRVDQLDKSEANPFVTLNGVPQAIAQMNDITRPREARVTIVTSHTSANAAEYAIRRQADGGTIPKTGKPYADRHLILAADGEEVVSNRRGQADAYRPVLKGINAGLSRSSIRAMLADGGTVGVETAAWRAGAETSAAARELARSSREAAAAAAQLAGSTKALARRFERLAEDRKDLVGKRDSLRDSVAGGLKSNVFGGSSWSSTGNPLEILNGDIANARLFESLRSNLTGRGLRGPALENALAEGGLAGLQQLSGMTTAQLRAFTNRYQVRESLVAGAAGRAGDSIYGSRLAAMDRRLDLIHRAIERNTKVTDKAHREDRRAAAGRGSRASRRRDRGSINGLRRSSGSFTVVTEVRP